MGNLSPAFLDPVPNKQECNSADGPISGKKASLVEEENFVPAMPDSKVSSKLDCLSPRPSDIPAIGAHVVAQGKGKQVPRRGVVTKTYGSIWCTVAFEDVGSGSLKHSTVLQPNHTQRLRIEQVRVLSSAEKDGIQVAIANQAASPFAVSGSFIATSSMQMGMSAHPSCDIKGAQKLLTLPEILPESSKRRSDDMESDDEPLLRKKNSPIKGSGVKASTPINQQASIGKMFNGCNNISSTVSVHEDLTPKLKRQWHSSRVVNSKASKRRRLLNSDSDNDESTCKTLSGSQEYESFCTEKTEKEAISQSGGEDHSSLLHFPDFLSET